MASDSFPRFYTACRISIELVVLNGKHGERELEVEEGLLPFSGFGSRQSFPSLGRDSGFHVATGPAKAGYLRVTIELLSSLL